jgi:hypothetical protein
MMRAPFSISTQSALLCAFLCLFASACRGQPDLVLDPVEARPLETEVTQPATSVSEEIQDARGLLKAGQVDDAAARLVQMQHQRMAFDATEAQHYRQAYAEAYDRALEAIQRGDPRGEIALRLLRAAGPR